jgi:arabinogalactan endo-1,4-beta-galactosidase
MLHYAGTNGSDWFFNQCKDLDFDYIGISYYPIWHGKNMETLKTSLNTLGQTYKKKVLVAETSYQVARGDNRNGLMVDAERRCKRYAPKTHEYILVFRKPGEYIVPDYCTENIIEKETKLKQFFE